MTRFPQEDKDSVNTDVTVTVVGSTTVIITALRRLGGPTRLATLDGPRLLPTTRHGRVAVGPVETVSRPVEPLPLVGLHVAEVAVGPRGRLEGRERSRRLSRRGLSGTAPEGGFSVYVEETRITAPEIVRLVVSLSLVVVVGRRRGACHPRPPDQTHEIVDAPADRLRLTSHVPGEAGPETVDVVPRLWAPTVRDAFGRHGGH